MIWLTWRQQRTETLIAAGILALLAVAFVPAGIHLADLFAQQHLAHCVDRPTPACRFAVGNFADTPGTLRGLLDGGWFNLIPGLIGVSLAAPLLLDLENGTIRLAWTQSVTRRRWLATKGIAAVGTVLLAAVAFSLLFTWYQRPLDRIYGHWDKFDFEWIAPVGYALFALGLALAIGVLLRRSAVAMVVAFGAFVGARLFVESWLRQRFITPLSATWSLKSSGPDVNQAWVISEAPSDRAGHIFNGSSAVIQACSRPGPKGGNALDAGCMARHGAGYTHMLYEPAGRFWEIQGIETALFAGLALVLAVFAAWRFLRAD